MHILLCTLLSSIPSLRYLLRGLGTSNRGQTSVEELLSTIAGFGRRTQEEVTNTCYGVVDVSKICRLTAEVRRVREQFDELDANSHSMHIQLRSTRDTLDH